jgi:hypothetical protein
MRARWIESDFGPDAENAYKSCHPAASFTAQPMALKEIYINMIRNNPFRKGGN